MNCVISPEACHLPVATPLPARPLPPPPHPLRVKTSSPGVNQKTHTVGSAACCAVGFCLEGMKTVVMHVMNKPGAAAASALRALCQRGVDMWSTLKVVFPFTSPSLPPLLLISILTWSMISTSLLPPPLPSHGTRSPAACLLSFLFLV